MVSVDRGWLRVVLLLSVAVLIGCCNAFAREPQPAKPESPATLGIQAERPSAGRFVKTDRGFMVPYTAKIPGTEVEFTMVPVPGGKHPVTRKGGTYFVQISPFWMAKTEVTWAEYKEYMQLRRVFDQFNDLEIRQMTSDNQVDAVTAPSAIYEPSFRFSAGGKPNHPAVSMRSYAAKQYTKWLSLLSEEFYRLPSEAEWEYACLAGAKTAYSFGNDPALLNKYGWYYDNCDEGVMGEVATKLPNAWGLYDMHGNAMEWVLDSSNKKAKLPAEGSAISVEDAIVWPTKEYDRIAKGGSWDSEAKECQGGSRLISSWNWFNCSAVTPPSPWWLASDVGLGAGFRIMRPLSTTPRMNQERYWRAELHDLRNSVKTIIDQEGRGRRGIVGPDLPKANKQLEQEER